MRPHVIARKTHKWIGLLVGLQVVVWSLSGLYMTAIHIDIIHGDHFIRPVSAKPMAAAQLLDPIAIAAAHGAHDARLAWVGGRPAYMLANARGEAPVDARSGRPLAAPGEAEIRGIAKSLYAGDEQIASAALITELPGEVRGRTPPLWRVEFDHWDRPTLYLAPLTGELVTRRHELWRVFDFVWMMHIMDYRTRDDVNNPLLRVFTWGAVLMALSGVWLLFYAFPRKKTKGARR